MNFIEYKDFPRIQGVFLGYKEFPRIRGISSNTRSFSDTRNFRRYKERYHPRENLSQERAPRSTLATTMDLPRWLKACAESDEYFALEVGDLMVAALQRSKDSIKRSLAKSPFLEAGKDYVERSGVTFLSKDAFMEVCSVAAYTSRGSQRAAGAEVARKFKELCGYPSSKRKERLHSENNTTDEREKVEAALEEEDLARKTLHMQLQKKARIFSAIAKKAMDEARVHEEKILQPKSPQNSAIFKTELVGAENGAGGVEEEVEGRTTDVDPMHVGPGAHGTPPGSEQRGESMESERASSKEGDGLMGEGCEVGGRDEIDGNGNQGGGVESEDGGEVYRDRRDAGGGGRGVGSEESLGAGPMGETYEGPGLDGEGEKGTGEDEDGVGGNDQVSNERRGGKAVGQDGAGVEEDKEAEDKEPNEEDEEEEAQNPIGESSSERIVASVNDDQEGERTEQKHDAGPVKQRQGERREQMGIFKNGKGGHFKVTTKREELLFSNDMFVCV
jgi:hypothetical protein